MEQHTFKPGAQPWPMPAAKQGRQRTMADKQDHVNFRRAHLEKVRPALEKEAGDRDEEVMRGRISLGRHPQKKPLAKLGRIRRLGKNRQPGKKVEIGSQALGAGKRIRSNGTAKVSGGGAAPKKARGTGIIGPGATPPTSIVMSSGTGAPRNSALPGRVESGIAASRTAMSGRQA